MVQSGLDGHTVCIRGGNAANEGLFCMQINNKKKKTGVIAPKKFVQRLKRDNELFRSYMHQVQPATAVSERTAPYQSRHQHAATCCCRMHTSSCTSSSMRYLKCLKNPKRKSVVLLRMAAQHRQMANSRLQRLGCMSFSKERWSMKCDACNVRQSPAEKRHSMT